MRSLARNMLAPVLAGLTLLTLPAGAAAAVPEDARWSDAFNPIGIGGTVCAAIEYDGQLVVGGGFRYAGPVRVDDVARWDGAGWGALGQGLGDTVRSLAVFEGALVACGDFGPPAVPSASVALWDGAAWNALGEGIAGGARALAVFAGRLHCGAHLWTGVGWEDVLQVNGAVADLEVWNGLLVAAGDFTTAAGAEVGHAVAWDGAALQAMPLPGGCIQDLEVVGGELFCLVANRLDPPPDGPVIWRWDGQAWEAIPTPASWGTSRWPTLGEHGGRLACVQETIDATHNIYCADVFVRDGGVWAGAYLWLPAKLCLVQPVAGGTLLAGRFDSINLHVFWPPQPAAGLVLDRDGQVARFLVPGDGLAGAVHALADTPEGMVAGGSFVGAGATSAAVAAAWTSSGWVARSDQLGPNTTPPVDCTSLACDGSVLHGVTRAFSDFDESSWWTWHDGVRELQGVANYYRIPLLHILPWRGLHLSHGGHDGIVDLTPGSWGTFAQADGPVVALADWQGELVATGSFLVIGAVPAVRVAACDGVDWRQLGAGLPGPGTAIAADGPQLAVAWAGEGGAEVDRWDGDHWEPLGPPFDGVVEALCFLDGRLYAGGAFDHAGADAAAHVAVWDGAGWRPLGSGTDDVVRALAAREGRLFIGGDFREAGGKASFGIAAWSPALVGVVLERFAAERAAAAVELSWRLAPGLEGELRLDRSAGEGPARRLAAMPIGGRRDFEWSDVAPPIGPRLTYTLSVVWTDGVTEALGTAEVAAAAPAVDLGLVLAPPRPNPANPGAEIRYALGRPGPVRLTVHDARGRLVAVLVDGGRPAGEHVVRWDGRDRAGRCLPAGAYLLRLRAAGQVEARKLTLLP